MFLSILIIFREFLNLNKAYTIKHAWIIRYIKICPKMPVDVIKFIVAVRNWLVRCEGFNILVFYNGSCQDDVKFMFW